MRKRYAKAEAAAKQTKNEEVASRIRHTFLGLMAAGLFVAGTVAHAAEITTAGQPARLDIRAAGEHTIFSAR